MRNTVMLSAATLTILFSANVYAVNKAASLYSTQKSGGSTDVNTEGLLEWRVTAVDTDYFDTSGLPGTNLVVKQDGDYLVAVTLPMGPSTVTRSCVQIEVYVNNTAIDGSIGESSYIRAATEGDGHNESSAHAALLLTGLSANDEIHVRVKPTANSGTVNMGQASLYAEYIDSSRTVFSATHSGSLDFNSSSAQTLTWTSNRKDSGFTHTDGNGSITLDSAGDYLLFANIPVTSSSARTSPKLMVQLAGTTISGGHGRQGYIRDNDGHNDASIHWAGLVRAGSDGQVLTLKTQLDAESGTVNLQSGKKASIYVEKIDTGSDVYYGRGTEVVTGGTDWNHDNPNTTPYGIKWANDDIIDTDTFTHSTSSNPHEITVKEDGDYVLVYNDNLEFTATRLNIKVTVATNDVAVPGAETKSNYIRGDQNHRRSSSVLAHMLNDISAGTKITVRAAHESGDNSTATAVDDALLFLWRKASDVPELGSMAATNIGSTTATLLCELVSTGAAETAVHAYWGETDGGTNKGSWTSNDVLSAQSEGWITNDITGLTADTLYYYTFYASNSFSDVWIEPSQSFMTGDVSIQTASDGNEDGPVDGKFAISRPGTATNGDLIVSFEIDTGVADCATEGTDYTLSAADTVTIAEGYSSATVSVSVIDDWLVEADEAVKLNLLSGDYGIGASSNATVTITNRSFTSVTQTWDNGGADVKWSTAANWVGDTLPSPGDIAEFGDAGSSCTIDVDTNIKSVVINRTFTLNGPGELELVGGGSISVSAGDPTFNAVITGLGDLSLAGGG
ncbi:MAG: hypothetical protein R6V03_11210, partial [Kiritimatiellia bacterium]